MDRVGQLECPVAKNEVLKSLEALINSAPQGLRKAFFLKADRSPCEGASRCMQYRTFRFRACVECDERPAHRAFLKSLDGFDFVSILIATTELRVRHEENILKKIQKRVKQLPLECFHESVSFL